MERVQQQNTKKPRVELTMREVKQEVEEGEQDPLQSTLTTASGSRSIPAVPCHRTDQR